MSLNTGEVVNSLRAEKARLELNLRKVTLALEALLGGKVVSGGVRARKQKLTCQRPQCKKEFLAARRDAKYCTRACALLMDKRKISKGVTLVAGAQK